MKPIIYWLQRIEAWLTDQHLSVNTTRSYRRETVRLLEWTCTVHSGGPDTLDPADYQTFLTWLGGSHQATGGPKLNVSSIIQARRITSLFLQWLVEEGDLRRSPAWRGKTLRQQQVQNDDKEPCSVSEDAVELPNTPPMSRWPCCNQVLQGKYKIQTSRQKRWALVMNLAFWAGLKPAQMVTLQRSQFFKENDMLWLETSAAPSHPPCRTALPQHLLSLLEPEEENIKSPLVLCHPDGKPFSVSTIRNAFRSPGTSTKHNHEVTSRSIAKLFRALAVRAKLPPGTIAHQSRVRQLQFGATALTRPEIIWSGLEKQLSTLSTAAGTISPP